MRNHYPVAVHLLFIQNRQVLLLRRFNTGYEDGHYSVVAGHVEAGETVKQAAAREAQEEAGVTIDPLDIAVVQVMHRKAEDERVDFFVLIERWTGEVANHEPQKCDDLAWFPLDHLPDNIIPYVKRALENYQHAIFYSEFGWP
jgi:8-oxo-dGTP diphosphatase